METKVCSKCKEEKDISNFRKDKYRKDGYTGMCKYCIDHKYELVCSECGCEFKGSHKGQKFCSNICKGLNYTKTNTVKCNCDHCGKDMVTIKSEYDRRDKHYCSIDCKNNDHSKLISGENHPNWSGGMVETHCDYCGCKMSIEKYRINKNKNNYCSTECLGKHRITLYVGDNNPKYNFEKTDEERIRQRKYKEYSDFVKKVMERDDFICQCCLNSKSGHMNVHHLNSHDWDLENRINPDNGITLCEDCHKDFHATYGYGKNNINQYKEYIRIKRESA